MAGVKLKNIYKKYPGGVTAVNDFNLDIEDKEFVVLVGPSGCGKTSLLKIMAGIISPSAGTMLFKGEVHQAPNPNLSLILQTGGLFPWKTVYKNLVFPLHLQGVSKEQQRRLLHNRKDRHHRQDLPLYQKR